MIFAYVTMCILTLHTCAPEVVVAGPGFSSEEKCWNAVNHYMDTKGKDGSDFGLTFHCASPT